MFQSKNTQPPDSIEDLRKAVESFSGSSEILSLSKPEKQEWIVNLLANFEYERLSREDKGTIRTFIQNETGYSRTQTARLIKMSLEKVANQKKFEELPVAQEVPSTSEVVKAVTKRHGVLMGRSATAGLIVALLLLLSGRTITYPSDGLTFLNAQVSNQWDLPITNIPVDPFDVQSAAVDQNAVVSTNINTLITIGSNTQSYPLLVQREELQFVRGFAVAYEKLVAGSFETLADRVAKRKGARELRKRMISLLPAPLQNFKPNPQLKFTHGLGNRQSLMRPAQLVRTHIELEDDSEGNKAGYIQSVLEPIHPVRMQTVRSSAPAKTQSKLVGYVQSIVRPRNQYVNHPQTQEDSMNGIYEQVRGRRVLRLSTATIPQVNLDKRRIDIVPKSVSAQESRTRIVSSLFKSMAARRADRLARIPESERQQGQWTPSGPVHASAPAPQSGVTAGPTYASAPNLFNAIGVGKDGQVLMIVDGAPVWTFINQTNVQPSAPHGGYISRRGGGSGRGGGGGGGSDGADGAPGATGATGATGPAGPTLGIYDSLGLESTGGLAAGDAGTRDLYNVGLLTASGKLIVEHDVRFNSGVILRGVSYLFPSADGSNNQVLTTDGNGNLTWEDGGGVSYNAAQGLTKNASNFFSLNSTITGSLVSFTTVSGATVHATDLLTSSGRLIVEGLALFNDDVTFGSGIVLNGVTYTFPVGDGSASGKVLKTNGAGQLVWSDDNNDGSGGSFSGTGSLQDFFDNRYVNRAGDTMSGSLGVGGAFSGTDVLARDSIRSSGTLTVAGTSTLSGSVTINDEVTFGSGIIINGVTYIFPFGDASASGRVLASDGAGNLSWTVAATNLTAAQGLVIANDFIRLAAVHSGTDILATDSLRASGTLAVTGTTYLSGAVTINDDLTISSGAFVKGTLSGHTIAGFNLADCQGAGNKLVYNASEQRFECETDTDTDTDTDTQFSGTGSLQDFFDNRYVNRAGDTMSGSLGVGGAFSGTDVLARDSIRSSGTLTVAGTSTLSGSVTINDEVTFGSGIIINGVTYIFPFGDASASGRVLASDGAGNLSWTVAATNLTAAQGLVIANDFIRLAAVHSGTDILATDSLRASGTLAVTGTTYLSGAVTINDDLTISSGAFVKGTLSGHTIAGFNLADCQGAGNKLVYNASEQRFECETDTDTDTDTDTQFSGTGSLQDFFDNRYVNRAGDTMSGSLGVGGAFSGTDVLARDSIRSSGTLTVAGTSTLSGSVTINDEVTFGSGIIINGVTYIFPFGDASASGRVLASDGAGNLSWTVAATNLTAAQGLVIANDFIRLAAVHSGTDILATDSLRASGTLAVTGTTYLSGAVTINDDLTISSGAFVKGTLSGHTIAGFNLADCQGAGNKLVYNASEQRFECETDTDTDTDTDTQFSGTGSLQDFFDNRYVNRAGDTMSGSLGVGGAFSGTDVLARDSIRSSGTLTVAGTSTLSGSVTINDEVTFGSGIIINGVTYIFPFGDASASGRVLASDGAGNLSWTVAATNLTAAQGLVIANDFIRLAAVHSGTDILATDSLRASGTLAVTGTTYLSGAVTINDDLTISSGAFVKGTLSGHTIAGFNLADCQGAGNKLVYNASEQRFECETDTDTDTDTDTQFSGTGSLQDFFDNRYVNRAGDTMSGSLGVGGAFSGTDVLARDSIRSSGTLTVAGTSTLSGSVTINDEVTFGSGIIINGVTYIFPFGDGSASGKVLATDGAGNLSWTTAATNLAAGQGLTIDGGFVSLNAVHSGTDILAVNSLRSSGTLAVTGASNLSGAVTITDDLTLNSGAIINGTLSGHTIVGFGLVGDCDNATNSKLLWDATTQTFSCGSDQGGSNAPDAGNGLNLDGNNFFALNTSFTGSDILALDSLRSSGTLAVAGESLLSGAVTINDDLILNSGATIVGEVRFQSGIIINDITYIFPQAQGGSGTVLATDGAGNLTWTNTDVSIVVGQGLTNTDGVITLNEVHSGTTIEATTLLSGALVHAQNGLTTSGTLQVDGQTELNTTFINGVLTLDADDIAVYDAAPTFSADNQIVTKKYVDDSVIADTTFSGTGSLQDFFDNRYVNRAGDTMSGSLGVGGAFSGTDVLARDSIRSSGTLVVDGTTRLDDEVTFGSGIIIEDITYIFPKAQGGSGTVLATDGAGNLTWTDASLQVKVGQGLTNTNGVITLNAVHSGTDILAVNSLRSSGTLAVTGTSYLSGAVTVTDDLTVNSGAFVRGTLSGYILHAETNLTSSGGLSVAGPARITDNLDVIGTASGRIVHAQDLLRSSGALAIEGDSFLAGEVTFGSGIIINGVTYIFPFGDASASGRVLASDGAGNLSWTEAASNLSAAQGIVIANNFIRLAAIHSGTDILATDSLRASGTLAVTGTTYLSGAVTINDDLVVESGAHIRGTLSGHSLLVSDTVEVFGETVLHGNLTGNTLEGFGLSDCTGGNKLLWNATTKVFECGVDASAGSGLDQNSADARYVEIAGDTMTGALLINVGKGNESDTPDSGVSLEVIGLASGRTIHAQDLLATSGSLVVFGTTENSVPDVFINSNDAIIRLGSGAQGPHGLAFGDNSGQGMQLFYRTGPNQLLIEKGDDLQDNEDLFYVDYDNDGTYILGPVSIGNENFGYKLDVTGSGRFSSNLEVGGTLSGVDILSTASLRSSGTLVVDGTTRLDDEVTFGSGIIINGVTYIFPFGDGSASGKVLATDGAGNLSWTDGGSTITAGQGLSVDGNNFISLNTAFTGTDILALDSLRSSGTLAVAGESLLSGAVTVNDDLVLNSGATIAGEVRFQSGIIINDITYIFPKGQGGSGTVLATNGNGDLTWTSVAANIEVGQGLTNTDGVISLNEVLSGTDILATDSLRSSGTLAVTGTSNLSGAVTVTDDLTVNSGAFIKGTLSGHTIAGFNLADCQGAGNKLVYNASEQRFECETDTDTDTNTQFSGTGSLQDFFDNRYVNRAGDTMSGSLGVGGAFSGTDILARDSIRSSGTLVVDGTTRLDDEVTFGSGIIIQGITYRFPRAQGGSGTVLATNGNGDLTWTDASLQVKVGQGLSNTNGFIVLNDAFSGTTIEATTLLSGALVHATNNLTSSGGLSVDGQVVFQTTTDSTSGFKVMDANGGTSVFNIDTTNERVGIGSDTPGATLEVIGSSTASLPIGLFLQNGVSLEDVTANENRSVIVQGDGAAYFTGRDVTNDIEFTMGTSSAGAAFVAAISAHDLQFRTGNTNRLVLDHGEEDAILHADWALSWGSSGVSNADTNLYRSAANVLKSDDSLYIVSLVSGATLSADSLLRSSGALAIENDSFFGGEVTFGSGIIINGVTYIFPYGDASASGRVLASDGAGNLSWTEAASSLAAAQGIIIANDFVSLAPIHSGTDILATDSLRASGTLAVTGTTYLSGAVTITDDLTLNSGAIINGTLSGHTIVGFGLVGDCDNATNSKLLWDATTQTFSCGSDQGGSNAPDAGNGLNLDGNNFFALNTSFTGSDILALDSLRSSGTLAVAGESLLSGAVTINDDLILNSGATIVGEVRFQSGIIINDITYIFPQAQGGSGTVLATDGAGNLTWTNTDVSIVVGQGLTNTDGVITLNEVHSGTTIEATTLLSGALVHAQNGLTTSGTLQVDGQTELNTTFINGVLTLDADDIAVYDAAPTFSADNQIVTKKYVDDSVIADTTFSGTGSLQDFFDNRYVNRAGDTMSGSLGVGGAFSGTDVLARDSIRSSGTLVVDGTTRLDDEVTFGSGIIIEDITYIFPKAQGGSGTVLATDGNGNLTWTDSSLLVKAGQGLTSANGFVYLNDAFSGTTIEATTLLSGALVHAQNGLTSSGTLQVDGQSELNTTFINGVLTLDADDIAVYDAAPTFSSDNQIITKKYVDDSIIADTTFSGTGSLQAFFDNRWVNTAGDTMTGALIINPTGGDINTRALQVVGTMSGQNVHATDALTSSGILAIEGTAQFNDEVTFGSGIIINDITYIFPQGQGGSGTVLATNGNGDLTWTSVAANIEVGQGLTNTDGVITLNAVHSGTDILAVDSLRSSGTLAITGTSYLSGTVTITDDIIVNSGAVVRGVLSGATIRSSSGLIVTAGRVGIGTDTPGAALDIFGETSGDQLRIGASTDTGSYYKIGRDTTTGLLNLLGTQGGNDGFAFSTVNAGASLLVNPSGDVGLGGITTSGVGFSDASMTVLHSGNVGIGTVTPEALFEVAGVSSGVTFEARDLLASSGSLAVNGDTWLDGEVTFGSGIIINGVTYIFPYGDASASGRVLASDGAGNLSWTEAASSLAAAQGIIIANDFVSLAPIHSGTDILATDSLRASGTLAVTGTTYLSGAVTITDDLTLNSGAIINGTLSGHTIVGFGLVGDCDNATNSKLLWDATTQTFSCGSDQGGSNAPDAGNGLNLDGNNFFALNTSFTGSDILALDSLRSSGTLAVAGESLLSGAVTINDDLILNSGATIVGEVRFQSGIIINDITYIFPQAQGGSGTVLATDGAGNLTWTSVAASIEVGQGLTNTNGVITLNAVHSGTDILAVDSLRSSGTLAITGTSYLSGSVTITDDLTINSGAFVRGTLSGYILHAETNLTSSGGLSVAGPARITDNLDVIGTASGRIVHAQDLLRSSGALAIEGDSFLAGEVTFGSGIIIQDITYIFPQAQGGSGTVLATDGNGNLTWTDASLQVKVGQGLSNTNGFIVLNDAFSGTTIEATSLLSGALVHAQNGLTSSGGLAVESDAIFNGNVGIGDATPDATLNIQSTSEQLRLDYDDNNYARFIVADDGALEIRTVGTDEDIELRTSDFENAIYVDSSADNVGIGTATPQSALHVHNTNGVDLIIEGTSANPDLVLARDGQALGTMFYDNDNSGISFRVEASNADYSFPAGDSIMILKDGGSVGIGTDNPNTKLEVIGTISGSTVHAATHLSSSGGLVVQGHTSGSSIQAATYLASSGTLAIDSANIYFNALNCTGDSNGGALTVDANGLVTCSDDDGGGGGTTYAAGQGLTLDGNDFFSLAAVHSGTDILALDSLRSSGTLVIAGTSLLSGATIINDDLILNSGATIAGEVRFQSGIIIEDITYVFPKAEGGSGTVLATNGNGDLTWTNVAANIEVGQGLTNTDGVITLNAAHSGTTIEAVTLLSGALVHAQNNLTSSGGLQVMGDTTLVGDLHIDGGNINFGAATTIGDGGDGITIDSNGTLTIHDGTIDFSNQVVTFSLKDDATNGLNIDNDTLSIDAQNNRVGILTTDPSEAFEVVGTASGVVLHAQDLLRSSGALAIEGDSFLAGEVTFGSGIIINGVTYIFPFGDASASGRVLASDGAGNLSWTEAASSLAAGQGLTITNDFVSLNAVHSGTDILAVDSLRSSGTLAVTGTTYLSGATTVNDDLTVNSGAFVKGTLSGHTIAGFGLVGDCDADNQTIGWDATTQMFVCGDDDTSAGGGLTQDIADDRYVQVQGDTMTGGLLIDIGKGNESNTIDSGIALEVVGVTSGSTLHAQDRITVSGSTVTTQYAIDAPELDALTTGGGLQVKSNSANTAARNLVNLVNDNSVADGATVVNVQQDAAGSGIHIDQNGSGVALDIDSEAGTEAGIRVSMNKQNANANNHILFGYDDLYDANLFRSGQNDLTGSSSLTIAAAAFDWVSTYQGATHTDVTAEARTSTGTFTAFDSGDTADELYMGMYEQFGIVNVSLAGSGTDIRLEVEYWDGNSWEAMTYEDNTNHFEKSGEIRLIVPDDWNQTSVDTSDNMYFIRFIADDQTTSNGATFYSLAPVQDHAFIVESNAGDDQPTFIVNRQREVGFGTGVNLEALATFYTSNEDNREAIFIHTDTDDANDNVFRVMSNVAGNDDNVFRIQADGKVFSDGAYAATGADYAEWFFSMDDLEKGEPVCVDITRDNAVARCMEESDSNVIGVVSTNPAFVGNVFTGADGLVPPHYYLVGLVGQLPTRAVVAPYGDGVLNIRPGDALTPGKQPGTVRRALAGESTLGVALQGLSGEAGDEGLINVLISRKNSSPTVDTIQEEVVAQIASMEIGDEVQIMVADAVDNLDLDDEISGVVEQQIADLGLDAAIEDRFDSLESDVLEILQASADQEAGSGALIWNIYETLKDQITLLERDVAALSGAQLGRSPNYDSVAIEETLITGGDTRIGGDLYVDGSFNIEDLFLSGLLTIDGSIDVAGTITTAELEVESGATVRGPLNLVGDLLIDGEVVDLSALATATGSSVDLANIVVPEGMMILGNVTIDGMLEVLGSALVHGNLTVSGSLIINNDQAGYAMIVESGESVTVEFSSGRYLDPPIITASSDHFVPWRLQNVTGTGFAIQIQEPVEEDITFSWHAMVTENPNMFKGLPAGASQADEPFFVDANGVPLSSSDIWNACIRNQQPLDVNGEPFNCRRYRDDGDMWTHPDHLIQFKYDPEAESEELRLIIPTGYYVEVVEEEDVPEDEQEPDVAGEEEESEDGEEESEESEGSEEESSEEEGSEEEENEEEESSEESEEESNEEESEESEEESEEEVTEEENEEESEEEESSEEESEESSEEESEEEVTEEESEESEEEESSEESEEESSEEESEESSEEESEEEVTEEESSEEEEVSEEESEEEVTEEESEEETEEASESTEE